MPQKDSVEYRKTICPLDCPDSCGMIAKVEGGKVTSLSGDPEHPYTSGYICRKMRSYPARVYGDDRVLYPQLRIGAKGEGKFKRISWAEALSIFAGKIREVHERDGGEAILPYQYAGNMGAVNRNAGYGLYHKLGTSRLDETICSAAAGAGWGMHLGGVPGSPPETAGDSDLIIAWGINVRVSNIHFWQYIAEARKKGGRLLVVDPYRNETAGSADYHLQVIPGGDGALALGAIKELLAGDRVDREMLAEQTAGFEELESYLLNTPWSEFSRLSGLSREEIQAFTDLVCKSPKTFIRIGIGLSRNSRGGMSVRAIAALAAVLGLFSGEEGQGVLLSSKAFSGDTDRLRFPELAKKPARVINMAHLGHALTALTPPVKMFIVYSCNPVSVAPDASLVREGLEREDLFTVVHEQVMTPTARYADLLLPATTFLENRDLYTGYGHFQMGVVDPVIEPVGEAKSNFDLFQELARELGFTDEAFLQGVEDRLASYIETVDGLPEGFNYIRGRETGWLTSVRKRFGQSVAERFGLKFSFTAPVDPRVPTVPCLLEPVEFADKDLWVRLPLMLLTPPHRDLLNSTFGERFPGEIGEVLIHPEDAQKYNIEDTRRVKLFNYRGWAVRRARVTDATRPGLVVAEGIFWQTDEFRVGVNDLTSQKTTDIGDGPTFHESRVAIEMLVD